MKEAIMQARWRFAFGPGRNPLSAAGGIGAVTCTGTCSRFQRLRQIQAFNQWVPPGGDLFGLAPLRVFFSDQPRDGRGGIGAVWKRDHVEVDGLSGLDEALQEDLAVHRRALTDSVQQLQVFGRRALGEQVLDFPGNIRSVAQRRSDAAKEFDLVRGVHS